MSDSLTETNNKTWKLKQAVFDYQCKTPSTVFKLASLIFIFNLINFDF